MIALPRRFVTAWFRVCCVAVACAAPGQVEGQATTALPLKLSAQGAQADSLAVASTESVVALAWYSRSAGRTELVVSVSRDAGRSFSSVTVGSAEPSAFFTRAVVAVSDGSAAGREQPTISVAWPSTHLGRRGIGLARSQDLGRSFTQQFVLPEALPSGASAAALAFSPRGRLHVLWLAGQELFYSRSDGARSSSPIRIDAAASRCGVTAVAADSDEAVSAFWYRTFSGSDEEFAYARLTAGARSFTPTLRLSRERWQFESCPSRSPSLSIDRHGAIRFVFQAVLPGTPPTSRFFADRSQDGRSFLPRAFLDTSGFSEAERPQVAPDAEGGLTLVWDGLRNAKRYVMIRHSRGVPNGKGGVEADWMRPAPPIALDPSGAGAAPVVVPVRDGMLAAWITGDSRARSLAVQALSIDQLCGTSVHN